MRTLKLTLAYDGTNYVGWQRQANGISVQEVVENAFLPLVGADGVDVRPPTVAAASRTDAGVHALGQVASVTLDFGIAASAIQRALNVRLPLDIRVIGVVDVTPGFHARHHAIGKAYRYRMSTMPVLSPFDRLYVWHAPGPRDLEAMKRAAAMFVGKHDFSSFQASGASVRHTTRTIHRLDLRESAGEIVVEIEGDGFLRHMVRAIVGTIAEIGAGSRAVEDVAGMLHARDRQAGGFTAPPQGLTLVSVKY
jgi:tRNA pseudouridine38-40 synthase